MKNTKQTKELILEQLRKTPIIETTCQKIGISKMTLSRWKKENQKFSEELENALQEGRTRINDIAESILLKMITEEKFEPLKFWLNNNNPRYTNKLEITGKKDRPLTTEQKALIRTGLRLSSFKNHGKKK